MGWGNENSFKLSRSHDQDDRYAYISGTKRLITLKVDMQHRVLEYYQVCSSDDPGLTLTYFTARSNSVPYAFMREEGKTMDFSETIVRPKIKFYLFAIVYLPTLLPPTQCFFFCCCFSIFFFFFLLF